VQTEMLEEAFSVTKHLFRRRHGAIYFWFHLTGNTYFNGKVLQVSSNP
jgi:hypothetical protein